MVINRTLTKDAEATGAMQKKIYIFGLDSHWRKRALLLLPLSNFIIKKQRGRIERFFFFKKSEIYLNIYICMFLKKKTFKLNRKLRYVNINEKRNFKVLLNASHCALI